ncbi:NAD(P)-binding domain-containing protein, partial [Cellulomonas soli]|uniref:NAD(P)-binding domain-containing protein n=1 Tax=Cellulomonas soli TaxID=931535 RepID=UPI003F85B30B
MSVADPARRPGRLGVGVVGAGRVGAVLGSALRAAGHPVVAVSAISAASLERAASLLPGVPVLDVPEVVRRSELVLLTVPDDALHDLVAGLAGVGAWQPGQIVVHTSGRFGADVLAPARA